MKTFEVKVEIRPAKGVLDPEGRAVLSTLGSLGFEGVKSVTVGKIIEMSVEAEGEAAAREQSLKMCGEFLANPVIEVFSVEVSERRGGG